MNRKNSELKDMARVFLLGNYRTCVAAFALTGAIVMGISMIFEYVAGTGSAVFFAVNILLSLLNNVLYAGLMMVHLDIARHRRSNWRRTFAPFKNANRFVGLSVFFLVLNTLPFLPAVIAEAGRLVVIGQSKGNAAIAVTQDAVSDVTGMVIFLVILGGIAAVYFALSFFPAFYILIDDPNISVVACIAKSFQMMKGNKIRLLLLELSFIGWFLLAILSFGIGLLWVTPYYIQSLTNFYLDLTRAFDIHVSFSAEGLAEAGKFKDYLKDSVVVSVGDATTAESAEAVKTAETDNDTPEADMLETDKVTEENAVAETEKVAEAESDVPDTVKATEPENEESAELDTGMSVLDDKFFDE